MDEHLAQVERRGGWHPVRQLRWQDVPPAVGRLDKMRVPRVGPQLLCHAANINGRFINTLEPSPLLEPVRRSTPFAFGATLRTRARFCDRTGHRLAPLFIR